LFDNDRPVTQHDDRDPLYELDIVDVANEIARVIPGVTAVRLFGSRKYLGKRRSDLDLLISGPSSLAELNEFRAISQLYLPLDLWLEGGCPHLFVKRFRRHL
jgi:predicted nucleotidyltransferase